MNHEYENGFRYPNEEDIRDFEHIPEPEKIHVVMVEPGRLAREMDIGTDLYDLQQAVGGGFIEPVYWWPGVCAVVNDEGKLNGMLPNRALYDDDGRVEDIIFGPFFICDCSTENFKSLSEEQVKHFKEMFYKPERFCMIGGEIYASQYTPRSERDER